MSRDAPRCKLADDVYWHTYSHKSMHIGLYGSFGCWNARSLMSDLE